MSSSCLVRLEKFFKVIIYSPFTYSVPFYRRSYCQLQLKQQVKGCLYRTTHTGVNHNTDHSFAESDPDMLEFNHAYQLVRKAVLYSDNKALDDVVNWNAKVLDYNVQGGKKIRGLTVLKSFKILSEDLSSTRILEACILGWCVEMLQGFFLVADDIMDNSITRRGKPCWYKMSDVGLVAINDSFLLECSVYKVLEMYFKNNATYSTILDEFLQVTRRTVYGQCLDMLNVPPKSKPRFENFSLEKYYAVVEHKTSYYTFCLPVHLAMHLVGNFSKKDFELTRSICLKLGLLFQIQDDHLDTFGDPAVTGKIGTDISDGKCTWFSSYFFENAPESKRKIMMDIYGVDTESSVSKVLAMYKEMHMEEKFSECEQELSKEINLMIGEISRDCLRTLFLSLLKRLYQRKK